jgi:hypothetical protein
MGGLYEEILLPAQPAEVLDKVRRSANSEGWFVSELPRGILLTYRPPKRPQSNGLAVWAEPAAGGSAARFLFLDAGPSDGAARRLILRLLDLPVPVYGPPGATIDPDVPRDLYRPLGTGASPPAWVGRARFVPGVVAVAFILAFGVTAYFWGLPSLVFIWLAYMSATPIRELMLRRGLGVRSLEGIGQDVLIASLAALAPVAIGVVFWILDVHHAL